MSHEFPIPIADLDVSGREVKFPVRAAWIRGALEESDATAAGTEGMLDVRVSKSGNDVVVRGHLTADLVVPCARCLEKVTLRIDQPLTALMVPASELRTASKDEDLSPEELDVMTYSGDTIALDDIVRDELLLEIPMIPLCSEDCPGMSPPPPRGSDAGEVTPESAIDPRLAPLLRLKKMTEKKE
jgi:uncharacterized protein